MADNKEMSQNEVNLITTSDSKKKEIKHRKKKSKKHVISEDSSSAENSSSESSEERPKQLKHEQHLNGVSKKHSEVTKYSKITKKHVIEDDISSSEHDNFDSSDESPKHEWHEKNSINCIVKRHAEVANYTKNSKEHVIHDDISSTETNTVESIEENTKHKLLHENEKHLYYRVGKRHPEVENYFEIVSKRDPVTSHIRMEEIQWQRLMERKLVRETHEKELENQYMDEIKTQIRRIEKRKKIDNLLLKRRMIEFEKKKRINNNTFCRILHKKDKTHQIENEALYKRILEIDKQKQKNVEKLKERINFLEEKKHKEQSLFLKRIQDLERKREEEFKASQKRIEEMEKRKRTERKAWLLQLQRVVTLENELQPFSMIHDKKKDSTSYREKKMKDQIRVMENVQRKPDTRLPKLCIKKSKIDKAANRNKQRKYEEIENESVIREILEETLTEVTTTYEK